MDRTRPMFDAPRDGTRVLLWVEHENYAQAKTPKEKELWAGWCIGSWTYFNGGGWSWYGLAGKERGWAYLPKRADGINTDSKDGKP